MADTESEVYLSKIDPSVENTFIVYRHSNIVGKFVNLAPTPEAFQRMAQVLEETKSRYFALPEPVMD